MSLHFADNFLWSEKVLYDIEEESGDVEAFRIDATADGRGIISVVEG